MKVKSLLRKFEKNGLHWEIEKKEREYCNRGGKLFANGRVFSFSTNPCKEEDFLNEDISTLHVRRENDHSDIMTDYFAGYFVDTIKHALSLALEAR